MSAGENWHRTSVYVNVGLFFELSGIGIALSVCRALSRGAPWGSVLHRHLVRASVLAVAGTVANSAQVV